jgi:hypothetical protein
MQIITKEELRDIKITLGKGEEATNTNLFHFIESVKQNLPSPERGFTAFVPGDITVERKDSSPTAKITMKDGSIFIYQGF